MAAYDPSHIYLLFQQMLAKVRCAPSGPGFHTLSEAVNEALPAAEHITKRYLSDRYKEVMAALDERKDSVGLDPRYLDACCRFIGFENTEEFAYTIDRLRAFLKPPFPQKAKAHIMVWEEDRSYYVDRVEQCFYPGQQRHIGISSYTSDPETLSDTMEHCRNEGEWGIWCLPSRNVPVGLATVIKDVLEHSLPVNVVPIFSEDGNAHPLASGNVLNEARHFHLATAYVDFLMHYAVNAAPPNTTSPSASGVHVHGSGTVVLGNMNVQGTYISQKDMHIVIHQRGKGSA